MRTRTADGGWHRTQNALRPYDSMLSELADPQLAPDLLALRELIRSWRFYDHVRTDAGAPARTPRIGTRTPVLSADGRDLLNQKTPTLTLCSNCTSTRERGPSGQGKANPRPEGGPAGAGPGRSAFGVSGSVDLVRE
ncbi:hypothetical protein [Streptomyces sp. NPDC051183]|uniref:hypothetical protein n=1 Tax=Streptomyces sp. NPDC051183 TaxID=3155165 RepID=UPI003434A399